MDSSNSGAFLTCHSCGQPFFGTKVYQTPDTELDRNVFDKLRLNYCPTPIETNDIRNSVRSDTDALSSIKKDISQLESILKGMLRARKKFETSIKRKTSLLAPIRRIPEEILRQIMAFTCETDGHFSDTDSMNRRQANYAALSYSHVSHSWRSTTLDMPVLWSRLFLNIGSWTGTSSDSDYSYEHPEDFGYISRLLSLYLERSRDHPLSLDIKTDDGLKDVDRLSESDQDLIHLLMANDWRWEHLIIDIDSVRFLPMDQKQFNRLRSLKVSEGDYGGEEDLDSDWFSSANDIEVLEFDLKIRFDFFSFNWSNIKSVAINLRNLRSGTIFETLKKISEDCKELIELSLRVTVDHNVFHIVDDSVFFSFPRMRYLETNSDRVLSALTAPQLRNLDVCSIKTDLAVFLPADSVTRFLLLSRASLVSLTVNEGFFNHGDYVPCFEMMEALQELDCHDMEKELVQTLARTLTSNNSGLLPHLAQLSLHCHLRNSYEGQDSYLLDVNDDLVVFLESRCNCKSPRLLRLTMENFEEDEYERRTFLKIKCNPELKQRMARFEENGLSVRLNGEWATFAPQ